MDFSHLQSLWATPANIALIKYWGKKDWQIPSNPSLSMTLNAAQTIMGMRLLPKTNSSKLIELDFLFENSPNEKFKIKIENYFQKILGDFSWLAEFKIAIETHNTFPHSSGIASSASSMSALALNLLSLDNKIQKKDRTLNDLFKEASLYARLASGSAARSLYPGYVLWGKNDIVPQSTDEFAISLPYEEMIHPDFKSWRDTIVVIDANEKSVSSRAGHSLMDNHPFAKKRFEVAKENLKTILSAMKNYDLELLIEVIESEALMLHALMMTSRPSFILLLPESLIVIEEVKKFRKNSGVPICFTIDAGPNIHLLYPGKYEKQVNLWIEHHLGKYKLIYDQVGTGPRLLK